MMDWDDLKYFIAVARTGSLSAAARDLATHQPTVGRRLHALEARLGARLFHRQARGYALSDTGRSILEAAGTMETAAALIERLVTGEDARVSGTVRISVTDEIGVLWLTPTLVGLTADYPGIDLAIEVSPQVADLSRFKADLAIRLFHTKEPELVTQKVARLAFGLFGAPAYLARKGTPRTLADLREHSFVDFDEGLRHLPECRWLEEITGRRAIAFRSDNTHARSAATATGLGLAILPIFAAANQPGLVRVLPKAPIPKRDVWLATHPDLRGVARVRTTLDFLAAAFRRDRTVFDPET